MKTQIIQSPWGPLYYSEEKNNLNLEELKTHCHSREINYAEIFQSKDRKREYLTSRYLLRTIYFNSETSPLLNHEDGHILWPKGWSGSLSHKKNSYAFFAKKKERKNEVYGIDLEETKVSEKIFQRITTKEERNLLENSPTPLTWTLSFSIKESLFKCFAPHRKGRTFAFTECIIDKIDFEKNFFQGSLLDMKAEGYFYTLPNKVLCLAQITSCDNY